MHHKWERGTGIRRFHSLRVWSQWAPYIIIRCERYSDELLNYKYYCSSNLFNGQMLDPKNRKFYINLIIKKNLIWPNCVFSVDIIYESIVFFFRINLNKSIKLSTDNNFSITFINMTNIDILQRNLNCFVKNRLNNLNKIF